MPYGAELSGCESMKTAAIAAEYNPFHNGHKYHIEETRRFADRVVVLMSGSFVQRGEPAVYSKWQRAESAVKNGADLVLELPCFYSLSSSRDFASGAVKILCAMGGIDFLSFGSESGSLSRILSVPDTEPPEYSALIKSFQKQGLSYRAAAYSAAKALNLSYPTEPNDLLAAEYVKALRAFKSEITPVAIKRTVAHDCDDASGFYLSASALRKKLQNGAEIGSYAPSLTTEAPLFPEDMKKLIYLSVLNLSPETYPIRSASDYELVKRICGTSPEADFSTYLYNIKSKRYTMSRVKRTLLHILLNSGEKIPEFEPYLRVLALNNNGADILSEVKRRGTIKIITKLKKEYVNQNPSLALDIKAADIRSIALGEKTGSDFFTSPIKL